MNKTRYCSKIYGSSIPKRLGLHQGSLFPKDCLLWRSFMNLEDGFIQRPKYMDLYMLQSSHKALVQLKVSSYQIFYQ